MSFDRINTGRLGEQEAVSYLKKNGYRIVARNFKNYLGEIDIVAEDDGVVCFIEVRTRRGGVTHEDALSSVNYAKQRRLSKLALSYIQKNKLFERRARFDVISVCMNSKRSDILLIKGAFGDSRGHERY